MSGSGARWHSQGMPPFVLVHSPAVGPSTWLPAAQRLREAGCEVAVPSLLAVGEGSPSFRPRVVAAVAAGLAGTGPGQPLVLVRSGGLGRSSEHVWPIARDDCKGTGHHR